MNAITCAAIVKSMTRFCMLLMAFDGNAGNPWLASRIGSVLLDAAWKEWGLCTCEAAVCVEICMGGRQWNAPGGMNVLLSWGNVFVVLCFGFVACWLWMDEMGEGK